MVLALWTCKHEYIDWACLVGYSLGRQKHSYIFTTMLKEKVNVHLKMTQSKWKWLTVKLLFCFNSISCIIGACTEETKDSASKLPLLKGDLNLYLFVILVQFSLALFFKVILWPPKREMCKYRRKRTSKRMCGPEALGFVDLTLGVRGLNFS